jgi:hypothetical protein
MLSKHEDPTWSKMSGWHLVLPPSRPDTLDLRRIIAVTDSIPRAAKVGILGSTPEFRDLLHEMGFKFITILERNTGFYEAMSRQRIYQNEEALVEGDWLETLPKLTDNFHLLLSDLTAGNVPYDRRNDFYAHITDALAPGGMFIDKILTNENGYISIDAIQRKYSRQALNLLTANHFSCEAVFCSELQLASQLIDTTAIYTELAELLDGPRFQRFIRYAQLITPLNCIWYYGVPWSILRPTYCPRLQLLRRYDLSSRQPYHARGFQYVWKKGTIQ